MTAAGPPGAAGAAGVAGQAPSEEELAAVLAALRASAGPSTSAGAEPGDPDAFTAWRRRRLTALGVLTSRRSPR